MTTKVHYLRHTVAGVITKYPFAEPPTDAQKAAIWRECFQIYGGVHPDKGVEYTLTPVEADLLGPDDVIEVPERALAAVSSGGGAGAPEYVASGTGTVKNP